MPATQTRDNLRKKKTLISESDTSERRVAIRVWCDPAWGRWLSAFAFRSGRTLVSLTMTAVVELARSEGIEPHAAVVEQANSSSLNGRAYNAERLSMLIFVRPQAREWIRLYGRSRHERVANLIESALIFLAAKCRIKPPPPRTLVDRRVPR